MIELGDSSAFPAIHNQHHWAVHGLPTRVEPWRLSRKSLFETSHSDWGSCQLAATDAAQALLGDSLHRAAPKGLRWPQQPVFFISDLHADAEAFIASLVAAGGLYQTGPDLLDIELTEYGQQSLFIIGGDCLDKGPSNIRLLRAIRQLELCGAKLCLLAGNHDMRLLLGLRSLSLATDVFSEHFFVRMGAKAVALLKEIFTEFVQCQPDYLAEIPDAKACRDILFPRPSWFSAFPEAAAGRMRAHVCKKEVKRIGEKVIDFELSCAKAGLSIRDVYATALRCQQLFMEPDGEFFWFFQRMKLMHRSGSFLFLHAGVDDRVLALLAEQGIDHLNQQYREQMQGDLFSFYYGALANCMRTKYRSVDWPLTAAGVELAFAQGIQMIVHGHRSQTKGQRLMLRQGLLHIEADITLDRNSRAKEGLPGFGVGVTLIRPEGDIMGISKDYPAIKRLQPEEYLRQN